MPELLTRIILLTLVIYFLWFMVLNRIPKPYLTWLGGLFLIVFFLVAFLEPTNDAVSAVSDILFFPFTPLGLSLVLLISALSKGVEKVVGPQVLAATVILFVASLPLVAYALTAQAQDAAIAPRTQSRIGEPVEAIIVLGDTTNPTDPIYQAGGPVRQSEDGFSTAFVTRLSIASQLYAIQADQGVDPVVLVSPGFQPISSEENLAANVRALLAARGVPEESIIVDASRDIRGSALKAHEILAGQGLTVDLLINDEEEINLIDREQVQEAFNVILVAPAIRMRRARLAFAQTLSLAEQNVIPAPTDFYAFQLRGQFSLARLRDLIPNAEALALTTRIIEEYLVYIYYFIRGWLLNPLEY